MTAKDRARARWQVRAALKAGRIKKGACVFKRSTCSARVEAHHDDHAQPLRVFWVCRRHHRALTYGGGALPPGAQPTPVLITGRIKPGPKTGRGPASEASEAVCAL